jgi:uncharacterized protein with HEPN domain
MPRDYKVYLEDILTAIEKINRYVSASSPEESLKDEKTFDAVIRNLEVIGEAVKNIPDSVRSSHPDIEWKKIGGIRDVLIHEYFGVDDAIILDVLKNKLPSLYVKVREMMK